MPPKFKNTRKRVLRLTPSRNHTGYLQQFGQGKPVGSPTQFRNMTLHGTQTTTSRGNHWPPPSEDQGRKDRGAPFETFKHEFESSLGDSYIMTDKARLTTFLHNTYTGPVYALPVLGNAGDMPSTMESANLAAHGTTAIARTIPTNPAADAATFLGELLREGLPSMMGAQILRDKRRPARGAAGEYLNFEFGVKPIIADLKEFAHVAEEYPKILEQFRRDSGRNVRRRYTFPEVVERSETTQMGRVPFPLGSAYFVNSGAIKTVTSVKKTRQIWFSGCYTYYLHPGDSALDRANRTAQEASKLLNIELSLELIWNLAPWSWFVDWFSNVGDVIHNMTAFQQDGLVLRYGYVMETTIHEITHTVSGLQPVNGNLPSTFYDTFRTITKRRVRATPYGFGVSDGDLSIRQVAILAALGITKGSNPSRVSPS